MSQRIETFSPLVGYALLNGASMIRLPFEAIATKLLPTFVAMNLRKILILAAPLSCVLIAAAATEETAHRQFSVTPGGTVVVDVDFGTIEVSTNNTQEVVIDVVRNVNLRSAAKEKEFLAARPISFEHNGNTVNVRSRAKTGKLNGQGFFGRTRLEAKYTITVPAQFNTQLKTAGGSIRITDVTGDNRADTSGGSLHFARLHGPLHGDTSGGGIHVIGCEGDIKIDTSGGGIEVKGGSGKLRGDTSGGGITLTDFDGPARVGTSGGSLSLTGIKAALDASTSGGGITADVESLGGDLKLSTSGGGITVRLPANAAFLLDAETSAGSVKSDFAVETTAKKESSRLHGSVNGGGKRVTLRTSAGGIRIQSN